MYKHSSSLKLDEETTRYRVRIESDLCENEHSMRLTQLNLLENLVNNPDLMNCGPNRFNSMKMFHDGVKWVIEFESTIRERV